MRKMGMIGHAFALMAAVIAASPACGQTAKQIIDKAEAAIKSLKTYQAIVQLDTNMGKLGSMSMQVDLKQLGQTKSRLLYTVVGTPTGLAAMGAGRRPLRAL